VPRTRARAATIAIASLALAAAVAGGVRAEEALPPAPPRYFNDEAGLVPEADARRLDEKLQGFDAETSTQIVVAIFPKLPSPSLEDFTARTAQAWRVGREGLHNGAVLFVFVEDKKMRLEVGYGLEGALPDALAFRILEDEVQPRFRSGDFVGGLEAGIDAVFAATRGEYTAAPREPRQQGRSIVALVVVAALVIVFLAIAVLAQGAGSGRTYGRRGWRRDRSHWGGTYWGGGFGGGGGGFGGGGFSGGGGSFGGGGASSSW